MHRLRQLNRPIFKMAELTLTNGNIISLDEAVPRADTLVIRHDRIVYAGGAQDAAPYGNPRAAVIDLAGKTVVPGFNDNHLHAISTGNYFSKPNLLGLNAEQIIEKLKAAEKDLLPGEKVEGFGWDYPSCPNPHRKLLDRYFPNRSVVLFQYSGHAAWLNTYHLKKLKVRSRTPDPPGGKIERDSSGEPTGILKERAIYPIHYRRLIELNMKRNLRVPLFAKALDLFRENGITSIQDNTWIPFTVHHFNRLKRKGKLTARVSCWSYGMVKWACFWFEHLRFDPLWVRKGPRKYFMDGAFSPRTAMLTAPYRGQPDNFGLPAITPGKLVQIIRNGIRHRRQLALHAIGDGAIRQFLDALETFKKDKPRIRDLRFRLEHAQLIQKEDLQRLADWGILLAVQPSALIDHEKDRGLLGEARANQAYPYRSILNAGIPLSFGSDVPGESTLNPLELIHLAVNRSNGEAVTPLEALTAYTSGSAYAEFMESEKGTLSAGKLADCVVLSEDPTRCSPDKIKDIQVVMTITGGRIVFRKSLETRHD
jgi:predicted amidohydrolase YtcJ